MVDYKQDTTTGLLATSRKAAAVRHDAIRAAAEEVTSSRSPVAGAVARTPSLSRGDRDASSGRITREAVMLKAVNKTLAKYDRKRGHAASARARDAARRQEDFELYDADDAVLDQMVYEHQMRTALYMQKQQRAEAMAAKGTKLHEAATRPLAVQGKERQAGHESSARRGSRRLKRNEGAAADQAGRHGGALPGGGSEAKSEEEAQWDPEALEQIAADHLRQAVAARRIQRAFVRYRRRKARRHRDRKAVEREMRRAVRREKEQAERRQEALHALSEFRKHRACVTIQRWWRAVLRRHRCAALCWQSVWRGRQGRRRAARLAEDRETQRAFRAFLNAKATRIQTCARAWMARRAVAASRRRHQQRVVAAGSLQACWRGCLGRRDATQRRQDRLLEEQRRYSAATSIARAYRFYVRRRDGRVTLFFRRMVNGHRTAQQLQEAAVVLQRQFRRRQLLTWAHREYIKVGKATETKQHLRMMNDSDEYRTKFQAPVTTAGIGYVVVTSRPLWMESARPARDRGAEASNAVSSPPDEGSQAYRQARAQQAALASRALVGAAEQAISYGISYDITAVAMPVASAGTRPVPIAARAPADRTRLAQLERIQKRQRQTVGTLPSIHITTQPPAVTLPPVAAPATVTHVTALPPVASASRRSNASALDSSSRRNGTSPSGPRSTPPGGGAVAGGHAVIMPRRTPHLPL
eukprot:jgi/Tetstr1/439494/TSEL_027924.t1